MMERMQCSSSSCGKAGTNKNAYKITTVITTSLSNVFEEDILMEIEDI
jgi:hypothetical protein